LFHFPDKAKTRKYHLDINMIKKGSKYSGLLYLIFGLMVAGVSAYVYQQATLTVTQNIVEIATLTVKNSDLGNINEGQTLTYTSSGVPNLGAAVTITTTTQPVYLYFDSDVDSLSGSYSTYDITVKYNTVPTGGTGSGDACTMTLSSPSSAPVTLDAIGTWVFDLEITTTSQSVNANTPTTVTIVVSAESE
jgi:hypothetical protein